MDAQMREQSRKKKLFTEAYQLSLDAYIHYLHNKNRYLYINIPLTRDLHV